MAVVDDDSPERGSALRAGFEPVRRDDLVDPCSRVDVGAIRLPPEPEPEVLEADREPDHDPIARQDESVHRPDPRGRLADEPVGVGVAADDAVEGHDVRRFDGGGKLHEIAFDELDPVVQLESPSFLPGDVQGRGRPIDEDGMADPALEQLVVDDADPTADVEDGRARGTVRLQELEKHPRGPIRSIPAIPVAVVLSVAPIEDRREPLWLAPAAVHLDSLRDRARRTA